VGRRAARVSPRHLGDSRPVGPKFYRLVFILCFLVLELTEVTAADLFTDRAMLGFLVFVLDV
jgi:hypothetical protein